MGRITLRVSLVALILGLGISPCLGQDKPTQQKPATQKPATQKPEDTRVSPPAAPIAPLSTGTGKAQPSTGRKAEKEATSSSDQRQRPLTGVEQYTLSTMGHGHNYFYPLFQVAESGDTNPNNRFGSSTFTSVSTISGAFALNRLWSRYKFAANYAGSGFIYNQDASLSSSAHMFNFSQTIKGARSSLLLADAVSYLPEASFGYSRFGGFGGLNSGFGGFYGVYTPGLNGAYLPNQSILAGDSSRISNAAVGQYTYDLSPLSSFTFTGVYNLLRFPDSDFIDSNSGTFGFGYNHAVGRRDTLAVSYFGSVYRYSNLANSDFTSHVVSLMYRHQISHLLSLRLGGGPQINIFNNAPNGNTSVSGYANAALYYSQPRTLLGLLYWHYTTAGAGVFLGAQTDNVELTVNRLLTRKWTANVGLGYAHNKNLQDTSESQTFNTWFASANLRRILGPHMDMFLSYSLQQQVSTNPFCIGSSCGTFYTRNFFSLGLNWHPRTVELGGID